MKEEISEDCWDISKKRADYQQKRQKYTQKRKQSPVLWGLILFCFTALFFYFPIFFYCTPTPAWLASFALVFLLASFPQQLRAIQVAVLLMLGYITDVNGELYGDVAKRLLLYTDTQAMMDTFCDTWWVIHYTRYAKVMGLIKYDISHILIKYEPWMWTQL